MKITDKSSTGLGVFISEEEDFLTFSHNGRDEGFIARFVAFPKEGTGMVVMINNDDAFGLMDEISNSISDVYGIPGSEKVFKKIKNISNRHCPNILGKYVNGDKEYLSIKNQHERMLISFFDSIWYPLYLGENNKFFALENDMEFECSAEDDKIVVHWPKNLFRSELTEDFNRVDK
jgi:hypothetical protein